MKKRVKGRKLHRKKDQREALLKSLARELILRERIKTTEARAKELRPFIEKLITKAKKQDLASFRALLSLFDKEIAKKLFKDIALRYKDRPGGYTRIIKLGTRKGDGAKVAIIEFV